MTYKFFMPFMKGFHLLMDSWRNGRATDGWKVQSREWESYLHEAFENGEVTEDEYLEMMNQEENNDAPDRLFSDAVDGFPDDLRALKSFFHIEEPPLVSDRVSRLMLVVYAFTDASGLGFGDTFLFNEEIEYTIRTWGEKEEGESSNYKELRNTIDVIE
jgi:hypothetical protein